MNEISSKRGREMGEISLKGFGTSRKKGRGRGEGGGGRSLAMSTKSILFLSFFLRETNIESMAKERT